MAKKPTVKEKKLLAAIASGEIVNAAENQLTNLLANGLVEINTSIKDEEGFPAVRATESGKELIAGKSSEPKEKPVFELQTGFEPPAKKRGGRSGSVYPFEKMEVGQSFHIPATEDRPEPWKSLASSVSAATAKFSVVDPDGKTRTNRNGKEVPVMIPTKEFRIWQAETNDPCGPGARVARVK